MEQLLLELKDEVSDIRIDSAGTKKDVNDLLYWRKKFSEDVEEAIKAINQKLDNEMKEQTKVLLDIKDKTHDNTVRLMEAINKSSNKLPLWASVLGAVMLTGLGWAVEMIVKLS